MNQASSDFSDCTFKEPLYDRTVDLTPLKGTTYEVVGQNHSYHFAICESVDDCGGGVCVKNNDGTAWRKFGGTSEAIYYVNGVAHLSYLGGMDNVCDELEISYMTKIELRCSHDEQEKPSLLRDGIGDRCRTVIDFPTPLMCPVIDEYECDFYSPELKEGFDLNPLSRRSHNYIVNHWREDGTSVRYVLNMCRNLLHQKDITCPPSAAACALTKDGDHQLKHENLGEILSGSESVPVARKTCENCDEIKIEVKYGGGDSCVGKDSSRKRSTVIELLCDPGKIVSMPQFVSDDGCEVRFQWLTAYACPISETGQTETANCSAVNPTTHHVFDLAKILEDEKDVLTVSEGDVKYNLGICKPHPNCGKGGNANSGACSEKTGNDGKVNLGKVNSRVVYNHGALQLTYTDGDECNGKTHETYSTLIQAMG